MPDTTTPSPAIDDIALQAQRRIAERASNLYAPLFDGEYSWFKSLGEDEQIALDRAALAGSIPDRLEPLRVEILTRFVQLMPLLNLVRPDHDPSNADFHWSAVRCVLAGAGHAGHATLAAEAAKLYPQCALDPEESKDDWLAALRKAHTVTGLPATISGLDWGDIVGFVGTISRDHLGMYDMRWLRICALLHILKHLRVSGAYLLITYRGTATAVECDPTTSLLASQLRAIPTMGAVLKFNKGTRGKEAYPAHVAMAWVLERMTLEQLLDAAPAVATDGNALIGPWVGLTPDPCGAKNWVYPGCKLTDAFAAVNGKVLPVSGDDSDVLGYAWRRRPLDPGMGYTRDLFLASLPKTYEPRLAMDTFTSDVMPNLTTSWAGDMPALMSLYDSVLAGSLLRGRYPGFAREFPMLWCLPDEPDPEAATNQGKSAAALALARTMTPGIGLTRTLDSTSAPDSRAIVSQLREFGSLVLEEWRLPTNVGHPLAVENVLALTTGRTLAVGEVLANRPVPVSLRQPLVVNAKCAALLPDMVNRGVFMFFRTLTAEERAMAHRVDDIESGRASMSMRLGMLATLEKHRPHADLRPVGMEHFRWAWHAGLAIRLLRVREPTLTEAEAAARINEVAARMKGTFETHRAKSETSGLMSMVDAGDQLRVRFMHLFEGLTAIECDALHMHMQSLGDQGGRCTIGTYLRARREASEINARSAAGILSALTGLRVESADRAIIAALSRDFKRVLPHVGSTMKLPESAGIAGWYIERSADATGCVRFYLRTNDPAHPAFRGRSGSQG